MLKPTTKSLFSVEKSIMLVLLMISFIFATDPILNIQGVLRDSDGQAVTDADYQLSFYLYDAETGGSAIWNETHSSVTLTNGVYSTTIGGASSLGTLAFDVPYYMAVGVNGGAESTPRIPLSLSPYSLSVRGVDNVFPSSGNVGIGTNLPDSNVELHVIGKTYTTGNIYTSNAVSVNYGVLFNNNPNLGYSYSDADILYDYPTEEFHIRQYVAGITKTTLVIQGNSGDVAALSGRLKDKTGYVSPVGAVIAFAGSAAPDGWLLCDGSEYNIGSHGELFNVISYTYGQGNGNNFKVPDLRRRIPAGTTNDSNDGWFGTMGHTGGSETHTLSVDEIPSHAHSSFHGIYQNSAHTDYPSAWGDANSSVWETTKHAAEYTGGGASHNNMPPYVVMNYIIKY
ncbi:MAG: tail fiber protein [Candidatus Marinimicrobia bacterium]|nr:tail fiber protein [Candidatus Neomarinimicrobiota bacterium]MBL6964587.1 tail fiber protein [Bacteroidota bacterium]